MHRNTTNVTKNHVKAIINQINTRLISLKDILPIGILEKHINHTGGRDRFYTPSVTIWSLLSQVLSDDQSCQSAVTKTIAHFITQGKNPPSSNTAAYCKARARLPESTLSGIAHDVANELEKRSPPNWLWKDKCIKLIDGSTISMSDTLDNQKLYPQSVCQKKGIGFPIARIAAIVSYATGSILEFAIGAFKGKEASELALIRRFLHTFNPEDVVIADSYYANYFMIAFLIEEKVDFIFPIHHARKYDFRKGMRLGKKDHVITWTKPGRPDWMDEETYARLPSCLKLREVAIERKNKGFRSHSKIFVTTFLDAKEINRKNLSELYSYRWHVELDLRSIKDIMHMDILRGKTPEMVHKEIWAHVLAYNLIRKIMAQAAIQFDKHPRQLSFKLTLQLVSSFRDANILHQQYYHLLKAIVIREVGNRSGRYEPRRIKRRPKPWDLLLKPRAFYHLEVI
jgi:hypothetical protein